MIEKLKDKLSKYETIIAKSAGEGIDMETKDFEYKWTYVQSIFFTSTIITTVGRNIKKPICMRIAYSCRLSKTQSRSAIFDGLLALGCVWKVWFCILLVQKKVWCKKLMGFAHNFEDINHKTVAGGACSWDLKQKPTTYKLLR